MKMVVEISGASRYGNLIAERWRGCDAIIVLDVPENISFQVEVFNFKVS